MQSLGILYVMEDKCVEMKSKHLLTVINNIVIPNKFKQETTIIHDYKGNHP